jgi:hypothetical protein
MNGSGNGATAGLTSLRAPFGLHQLLLGNLALAVTQHMTAKVPLAVVKAASRADNCFDLGKRFHSAVQTNWVTNGGAPNVNLGEIPAAEQRQNAIASLHH